MSPDQSRRAFQPRSPLAALLLAAIAAPAAAQPVIDGVLSEWPTIPAIRTDPVGDASGPLDLTEVRAASSGSTLYVQLAFANTFNLSSGPSSNPTLRMTVSASAPTARSITIDFRARRAWLDGNSAVTTPWTTLNFVALPTTASNRFELKVDLAAIGLGVGVPVRIQFDTADTLSTPLEITLDTPATTPPRRQITRPSCPTLRVASWNTLTTGLTNAARRPALLRSIDAVDADIYCFSEEYNSSQAQILQALTDADPLDNGLPWNVYKDGELVIASQRAIIPVPISTAYQAAVVRGAPGTPDLLVINNHLKCCGYIGNADDNQRIAQTAAAIADIANLRAGALGPALQNYQNAPAIVVGDWNLVGSSTPMDLWTAAPAPGLTRLLTRSIIGNETWTWRDADGLGFWPGALDAVAYDAARLRVRDAFNLDTTQLTPPQFTAAGLLAADSLTASDHLMMVIDLALGPAADFNASGDPTVQDIFDFLGQFFLAAPRADVNADNTVSVQDLFDYLTAYFGGC